ncbi:MAG: putative cobaltochelatase [Paludibacterium sp.]|uniref:putative cobaltochelatase n=1 Tax=Paludibacterium sp. TaxID=1917523 RepID=UPI0025E3515C|nr:putative cobaltochelatase [Paludibacterium sp.]MBV8049045.1 putative cobaltochelatase [Paludibacterium sp.]MBV8649059.1 putative cobaltochelatase [Paludibacterium sp.]
MKWVYPFAAIVGQTQLKQALLLCAVDPTLGGVLIRGDKGSAKSTAARGLAELLPHIARTPGCGFNCDPVAPLPECPVCAGQHAEALDAPAPFVNLPLGATEDRVLGSLDFEAALQKGRQAFKPGLLAHAHRGILYIDEVNLLADHLVDVLLDVAAMGSNTVEREGLSLTHPARISLIGTMNPEEGNLRPQLLDRFGLMVDVTAPQDPQERSLVVRRRLAFEADPTGFAHEWQTASDALRAQLARARKHLAATVMPDSLLAFISELCCEFEVASLRADIVLYKAARALAALAGREWVEAEDVRDAARLVLPHRRRHKPFEQTGMDEDKLDDLLQRHQTPPDSNDTAADETPEQSPPDGNEGDGAGGDTLIAAGTAQTIGRLQVDSPSRAGATGRRSQAQHSATGQYVRAVPDEAPTQLALDATLRHALMRNPNDFAVTRADLHRKERVGQQGNLILLVVDASGSMAAEQRMAAVKGCVLGLLSDAYQRRDQVGVIAFRGREAQLVLSPTRQVEQAHTALEQLPTGGRTPLPHALALAGETLARQAADLAPLLVILSDGRANVALTEGQDPWRESLAAAEQLAQHGHAALVLDTETGFVRMGRARALAQALGAEYLPLEALSSEQLTLTIRERLGR